jgi:hypothetical protein
LPVSYEVVFVGAQFLPQDIDNYSTYGNHTRKHGVCYRQSGFDGSEEGSESVAVDNFVGFDDEIAHVIVRFDDPGWISSLSGMWSQLNITKPESPKSRV